MENSDRQPDEMGIYDFIGMHDGRPAYQQFGGEFLYWVDDSGQWRVGDGLGGDTSVHINGQDDVYSPELVTEWRTHSSDGWAAEPMTATCVGTNA